MSVFGLMLLCVILFAATGGVVGIVWMVTR